MFFNGILSVLLCLQPGYPGNECTTDYEINVSLFPNRNMLEGDVSIFFTNGSPFPVDTLWLHLYPNAYRDETTVFGQELESLGSYRFRASPDKEKGWIELFDWFADGKSTEPVIDETLAYILPDETLLPGDSILLRGGFKVKIPSFWSRMGYIDDHFGITQWYPKMCVLDDRGWHRSRYHVMGEFYSDFGDYDVFLDIPAEFVTAATGSVEILSFSSDSLRRTEHWSADTVHDFAWMASPDMFIREHVFVYPDSLGGRAVRVHIVVLDDSEDYWADIPAVADSTLLYYGEWYTPYPYRDLWIIDCSMAAGGGMEYPQLVQVGVDFPFIRLLELVTAHEIGHQWFYGILANDEVDEAWLDEGMNTFSEMRYFDRKYGLENNFSSIPGWILTLSDEDFHSIVYVSEASRGEIAPVLSTSTDAADGSYSTGATYYSKPAFFLRMLQRQMGEELFDEAMKIFFERFTFHHPHTEDFQAIVEEVTGRSWQQEFDFWLRETGSADLRIENINHNNDSTYVEISGDFPHSLSVDVILTAGSDSLLDEATLLPGENSVISVQGNWNAASVDPFRQVPDRAPWNNSMPVRGKIRPLFLPLPRSTEYNTYLFAFPMYSSGYWKLNAMAASFPLPTQFGGPFNWSGGISIPLETGHRAKWKINLSLLIDRGRRHDLLCHTHTSMVYGTENISIGLKLNFKGEVPADPKFGIGAGLAYRSVTDSSFYGSGNIEEGDALEFSAGLSAEDRGYRLCWKASTDVLVSPGWNDEPYARINGELKLDKRLSGEYRTATRFYIGRVTGDPPVQILLRPGGGLFADSFMGSFLPPEGNLSPAEHFFLRSGPALPGYWNSTVRTRAGFSLEERCPLPLPIPVFKSYIFGGIGWLGDSFNKFNMNEIIANAGIGIRFMFLEGIFPVWVSDPAYDEDEWEFRWRIGFTGGITLSL